MIQQTLSARLSFQAAVLAVLMALAFCSILFWSAARFQEETTQALHRNLAAYVRDHLPAPLLINHEVNRQVLKTVAQQTMAINPLVELYLLDPQGRVLGHAMPDNPTLTESVDLVPIRIWLARLGQSPLRGQDPRRPDQTTLFSVAPLTDAGTLAGYLYIALADLPMPLGWHQVSNSEAVRLTLLSAFSLLCFWWIGQARLIRRITRPLKALTERVEAFGQRHDLPLADEIQLKDELDALDHAFSQLAQRIDSQLTELASNDRKRREFMANISHDLRTPLATLRGHLERIANVMEDDSPEDSTGFSVTMALRQCDHLTALIHQLFELSRLDNPDFKIQSEPFCLSELIQDTAAELRLRAKERSITLHLSNLPRQCIVKADIQLIQRALNNLLENALRHTPSDGWIELSIEKKSDQALFYVEDSGPGIAREELPLLFNRYHQTHSPIPPPRNEQSISQGHGLGLAIVRRIAALHGSLPTLDTAPGKGLRIGFSMPSVEM